MAKFVCATALVLAAMTATASALVCYSCDSAESVACKWGLTSFTYNTVECGTGAGVLDSLGAGAKCYKLIGRNHNGDERVARGCMSMSIGGNFACNAIAKTISWAAEGDASCDLCDGDKCNSASKITGFTVLGVLLAVFAFLF